MVEMIWIWKYTGMSRGGKTAKQREMFWPSEGWKGTWHEWASDLGLVLGKICLALVREVRCWWWGVVAFLWRKEALLYTPVHLDLSKSIDWQHAFFPWSPSHRDYPSLSCLPCYTWLCWQCSRCLDIIENLPNWVWNLFGMVVLRMGRMSWDLRSRSANTVGAEKVDWHSGEECRADTHWGRSTRAGGCKAGTSASSCHTAGHRGKNSGLDYDTLMQEKILCNTSFFTDWRVLTEFLPPGKKCFGMVKYLTL